VRDDAYAICSRCTAADSEAVITTTPEFNRHRQNDVLTWDRPVRRGHIMKGRTAMKTLLNDDNAREVVMRPTRRRVLYLLGGSVLVTGAMGLVHEPANARRKKCKRPCNSEEKCVRGKCVLISRP
jgi:hypothetical protein